MLRGRRELGHEQAVPDARHHFLVPRNGLKGSGAPGIRAKGCREGEVEKVIEVSLPSMVQKRIWSKIWMSLLVLSSPV